jgi:hypothetical protein
VAKSRSGAGTTLLFMATPFSLMPSNVMFGKASSLASEIRSTPLDYFARLRIRLPLHSRFALLLQNYFVGILGILYLKYP